MSMKRKPPMALARPVVKQSAKMPIKPTVDEAMATVSAAGSAHLSANMGVETIEISSDSSSNYDEFSDGEEAPSGGEDNDGEHTGADKNHIPGQTTPPPDDSTRAAASRKPTRNGADDDTEMMQEDRPSASASDDEATSPTFGDLLRGSSSSNNNNNNNNNNTTTTVNALIPGTSRGPRPAAPPPTLSSLGTVLNQALRTDDADLLESCLHTTDLPTVRATIERMDSALAGALLSRLAARMHRRPARAHSLMGWVQWTLVAHGGALASQPDLVRRLAELARVLDERARALPSLLALKGRLDMLDSQMSLRRDNLAGSISGGSGDEDEDEDEEDEEGVVYVEGEDETTANGSASRARAVEDDEMVLANGIGGETDDDSDDEGSLGDMDIDDDEVASQESLDESEVDFDDADESGDEDEDETDGDVAAPPAKMQKVGPRAVRK
ncbi:Dip2/Utp12 family-domain-containing protein [Phialemonium atrogriseum]|uniref:Dip2/Utp12 family-domain-containing protein n=1 Tax=Phialemonium atrogriseum TaxID=1093897 RepID=A0AAJ0FLR8_9PEZI|nr:Dip2/Utp12 family-domain-containing protein [Phialemonium atrogriseum]KAK1772886.1 Dip2/Utp12 family-domain-containing protein [Phialemonium atrogriseum]